MIRPILKLYYKLPCRPFRKQLAYLYNLYKIKDKKRTVLANRKGINFELRLKDRVASGIYYGIYEPKITEIFEKNLGKGDTVIDVGANVGYYTLLSAKLIGKGGKVYAFEPMKAAQDKLKKNISLNSFQNIILENKGVSDKEEKLDIFFQNEYLIGIDQKGNNETVSFVTLDNYVKKHKIRNVSILKVDTDGYDFKVIKGAVKTINKFKPIITVEVFPNEDYKDFVDFLLNIKGYKFYLDISGRFNEVRKEDVLKAVKKKGIINMILKPFSE